MQKSDLTIGMTVYFHYNNQWHEAKVSGLLGGRPNLNPGRDLVEVHCPTFGHEVFDAHQLYPAPDFEAGYVVQEVVERLPDNRVYEFGIGDINNADDPYYAQTQKTRKTGEKHIVVTGECDGCGGEFPRSWLMSASMGTACSDCYDRMSN